MGRKVYVWSNRVWMPDSATTTNMTGKVGGKPFTATSTTYGGNGGHDVICELRLIVHRLLRARARIDANMVDEDDFDEDREGWTAEQVWDAMRGSLPLVPDLVASHGDFSLDNVLICDGEVAGCIDAGRVGIADRYQDLAVAWNCLGEFGASLQERFLAQYGIHDLGRRKLQFHLMLDELF